jgi:ribose 5-phosphate isomerase B
MKKIGIAGDHAGFDYKLQLKKDLRALGYELIDFGPDSNESVDYPDHVHPLAEAVSSKNIDLGIAICGSGNGVCMTVNKHEDIRGALVWNIELAELARQHNDANIICVPARFVDYEVTKEMVLAFIKTEFEGGRHARRVEKIGCS